MPRARVAFSPPFRAGDKVFVELAGAYQQVRAESISGGMVQIAMTVAGRQQQVDVRLEQVMSEEQFELGPGAGGVTRGEVDQMLTAQRQEMKTALAGQKREFDQSATDLKTDLNTSIAKSLEAFMRDGATLTGVHMSTRAPAITPRNRVIETGC